MSAENLLVLLSVAFRKFGLLRYVFLSVIRQFINVGIVNFSREFYISHFGNKKVKP